MSGATLEAALGCARLVSQWGALPLLVGVTGHRDLRREDIPRLETEVERVLDGIAERAAGELIVVVSALAEGADRLVASVGVGRGCRLVAALPMSPEVYEEDFETEESREEFRRLLNRADRWFAVSEGRVDDPAGDRVLCYALAGAWLVWNCRALIALWDGLETGKAGGTSEVVRYAREGVPGDLAALLGGSEGDGLNGRGGVVVHHIPTPRASGVEPRAGA